jgi:hypothetical protein
MNQCFEVNGKAIVLRRRGFLRFCSLRDEYYDFVKEPGKFVSDLRGDSRVKADLFVFTQPVADPEPRFSYHLEYDSAAVVFLTTYDRWWKKQIKDKTRNMVRKAQKTGVEIRAVEFADDLIRGIHKIYNESPIRQGKPFWHYGKDLQTLRREHGTFLDQSQFFGAYHNGELIGFIKLVHGQGVSNLMNIVSMISHRDKAPTNALIAKAVEICTNKGVPRLHYGTGNSGSIGDFKKHHAFEEVCVPRYFVPLNRKGAIALRLGLHREFDKHLPAGLRSWLLKLRAKWLAFRYTNRTTVRSVTQPAEQRVQA